VLRGKSLYNSFPFSFGGSVQKTKVIALLKEKYRSNTWSILINHGRMIGMVQELNRGGIYLLRKNGSTFPVQLTHFYKSHVRFKVLSNPNPKKRLATYHSVDYERLPGMTIIPIEKKQLMEYFGTATPHMAEAIRKRK
jgi:hypothetical protein